MSRLAKIRGITIHCTAGFAGVTSIERYWRENLGWNGKGYSIIIELDGTRWYLKNNSINGYSKDVKDLNLELITNGVRGYNSNYIHIATIGGVDPKNTTKAFDTRTPQQKESLHEAHQIILGLLMKGGKDITKDLGVTGHRDFSIDKNSNGVIEPHEINKECPSWNVIGSIYHNLYSSNDRLNKLPYN